MSGFFDPKELLSPPTARAAYSDRTAWIMAKLSELAYRPFEEGPDEKRALEEELRSGGFELIKPFNLKTEKADTQAILVRQPGVMCALVFRGTSANFKDIFTDLNAKWMATEGGSAHRGFLDAFEAAKDKIVKAIAEIPPDEPLYVAGHSLGGALASVAAMQLDKTHTLAACYTYGSPRVGNAEWVKNIKVPVYRTVNTADGVPLVPFSAIAGIFLFWLSKVGFVGFKHVGDLRYLPKGEPEMYETGFLGGAKRAARIGWAVAQVFIRFDYKKVLPLVMDHKISGYVKKLQSIAEARNKEDKP